MGWFATFSRILVGCIGPTGGKGAAMAESNEPSRADDEIAALRAKYEAVSGKRPFVGWSAEMLQSEIATVDDLEQVRRELKSRRRWEQFDKALSPWLFGIGFLTRTFAYIVGGLLWLAGLYFF